MHISGYVAMMIGVILTLALAGGLILLLMRRNRNNQNQK
jgi:nitrate reductase gamma subunit